VVFPRQFSSLLQSACRQFQPEKGSQIGEHLGGREGEELPSTVPDPPGTNCERSRFGAPRSRSDGRILSSISHHRAYFRLHQSEQESGTKREVREKETLTRVLIAVLLATPSRPLNRWHFACTKSLRSFLDFPRCHPRTGLTDSKSSVSRVVGRKSACNSKRTAEEVLPVWHFWELPFT